MCTAAHGRHRQRVTSDPFALDDPIPPSPARLRPSAVRTLAVATDGATDLAALSDAQLSGLGAQVAAEQQSRAVAEADPEALTELGFAEGFKSNGLPIDPWMVNGVLVCPGSKIDKSATSHDCAFANVGGDWIWECGDLLLDTVRYVPGPKTQMRSVSLVAAYEGLAVDLVASKLKTGVHQMQSVRSFVVTGGKLQLVQARARTADHGR